MAPFLIKSTCNFSVQNKKPLLMKKFYFSWYLKAQQIIPKNGEPDHQLAAVNTVSSFVD